MSNIPASFNLRGKTAVVTGCGSPNGIGFASAVLLGQLGAALVITSTTDRIYTRLQELERIVMGIRATAMKVEDLSNEIACQGLCDFALSASSVWYDDSRKRIDILVNNAGMTSISDVVITGNAESGSVLSLSLSDWHKSHARNLDTAFLMIKTVLPYMTGWGRIVNISSTTGPLMATMGDVAYASAKAAMCGLTRVWK